MALGEIGDLFEEEVDVYVEVFSSVNCQLMTQRYCKLRW